jgi:dehydrogenase/reductase SDR family member 7B
MKDKVIIITGASSGIGRACAEAFGQAGGKIVITGRDLAKLEETSQWLSQKNIENIYIKADVSLEADSQKVIEFTLQKFHKIDVLVNNAGISMRALFEDVDLSVIRQLMETNFFGMVYATKYALPNIIASKGTIVGISSIAGHRGLPARTGYSASKFAMQGFLEALRTELIPKGVNVLIACPGFTASNIRNAALQQDGMPQGSTPREEEKMMSSETVAQYILKAVQKRKKEIILTSQGKLTVFLNKWLPKSVMDKLVFNALAKEKDSPLNH